jgi:hypothetical protein
MNRLIPLTLLMFSLGVSADEPVVGGIREKIKNGEIEFSCSEGKPVPESEREPSPAIQEENYSKSESDKILALLNGQPPEIKKCTNDYISKYVENMYQYCEKYNLAPCIGGGCAHTSGYSVHIAVLVSALEHCNVQP